MVKIKKFVHIMIIFILLFIVATNVEGKIFSFSNFLLYFIHNILSDFSYIILLCFFFAGRYNKCFRDSECPKTMCRRPKIPKCMYQALCKCRMPAIRVPS